MEKKTRTYMVVAVIIVIIVAAVGVVVVVNNNNTPSGPLAKVLTISRTAGSIAYSPLDEQAVYNNSYPMSRYLYLYTNGVPNSTSSEYKWLSYVLNETGGQQEDTNAGFYPLQAKDLSNMTAQLAHGNTNGPSGDFTEGGSTTMAQLAVLWADDFKNETGYTITITLGGSGTGISQFINGQITIAQSSRQMTATERASAEAKGINVTEWKVAVDGISIIVNIDNPITTLTMSQLEGLFNGTYTNWNLVGGSNMPVTLYGREDTSGTYTSFQNMVFKNHDNYTSAMLQASSNALIVTEVQGDKGGVGYVGIGYAKEAAGESSTSSQMVMQLIMASAGEDS